MSDKLILLIEDDVDTQRGVMARLRANGYRVAVSADATSAISEARRSRPDLILLDLGLPGGTGLGLLEQFKMLGPTAGVPVIVLSGRDAAINRPKALKSGAVAYFEKPADNDALLSAIRTHLGVGPPIATTGPPVVHARRATDLPSARKVLIIEDDGDTRSGLSLRLRANGYATAYAADASTALTVATHEKPDIVLLDLGLPGGDGYVVLERLRALPAFAATPVIVVSARDAHIHRPRAVKAGAVAYLEKPIDNELLLKALKTALG